MSAFEIQEGVELKGLDEESRQMVVDTVLQLRKRLLTKEKILEYDKNEIFPEHAIREMLGPEIGLQLLFIPEAYGGMDGGARDCHEVISEMCKICLGVGTAFLPSSLGQTLSWLEPLKNKRKNGWELLPKVIHLWHMLLPSQMPEVTLQP